MDTTAVRRSRWGETPRATVRRLQDEFRARGWTDDDGYAVAIAKRVWRDNSAPVDDLVRLAPTSFYARNNLSARQLRELFKTF